MGLVWGLKDFQPANYEAMTSSVSSLVDGIKVAFLTSIYGIAFSIVYTSGMKSEYSALTENLQLFLDKFHTYVMPSAETESMNLLVASQKNQTAAMNQMAEQFSVKMADSFEKVITPTFKKMNDSLDTLVSSVTKCQEDAVKAEFAKDGSRWGAGLPAGSDSQLLFLQSAVAKMDDHVGRAAIISNGSPLFTGDAGSGAGREGGHRSPDLPQGRALSGVP